eukprot:421214-Prymnesium_polylepis.1
MCAPSQLCGPRVRTPPQLAAFRAAVSCGGAVAHAAAPFFRVTGERGEIVISGRGLQPGGGGLRLFAAGLPVEGVEHCPPSERRGFCAAFEVRERR